MKSIALALLGTLAILAPEAVAQAPAAKGNLSLRNQIDFGSFATEVVMIGSSTESPVNHVKAKEGRKFLLVSMKLGKIAEGAKVQTVSFALEGTAGAFGKPGAWGKVEMMGRKSDFEASEGATMITSTVGDLINLFFEVPNAAREQDFRLRYRP